MINANGYWVPKFPETFHYRGEMFVAVSYGLSNVTGVGQMEHRVCIPFGWIDENRPRTIRIGNTDVPEPLRVAPEFKEEYWVVDIASPEGAFVETWEGDEIETTWLKDGLIHKSHAKAVLHANALISLSRDYS